MSFVAQLKTRIKQHPMGRYWLERLKKRRYERLLAKMDDRAFIEWRYKKMNPDVPLDLEHPTRFSEKLQWLKLHVSDARMTRLADKAELKVYLAEQGLGHLAVPTLGLYTDVADIDIVALPNQFVLKATHGSGWHVICRDKAAMEWHYTKKTLAVWLSESLYMYGRERHYKNQTPRVMAEPLLFTDERPEYKFMCFDGVARAVQVSHRVDGAEVVDIYDMEWRRLECGVGHLPRSRVDLKRPVRFEEMKGIAERLSQSLAFVRVDFYDTDAQLYIGELTFFTGGGFFPLLPLAFDSAFGEYVTLPTIVSDVGELTW